MSCCAGTGGLAEGDLAGVGITWVSAGWGDAAGAGEATGDGLTIPGVCSWPAGIGVPGGVLAGLIDGGRVADFRLGDLLLTVRIGFRVLVALGFGLGLLIPGITWPSCCANTLWPKENESENDTIRAADKNKCLDHRNSFFNIPDLV